jgi:outer membrane protein assembly factor BamB
VRWQRDLGTSQFLIGPGVGDGVVVVIDSANVASGVDARTGEVLWRFPMASQPAGSPVVTDGVVHLVERGRTEDVAARNFRVVTLDAATGRFVGSYEPPGTTDTVLATVGSGPDGELLVPTVDFIGGTVETLSVLR